MDICLTNQELQSNTYQEMSHENVLAVPESTPIVTRASERDCLNCKKTLEPEWKQCPMCATKIPQLMYKSYNAFRDSNLERRCVSVSPSSSESGYRRSLLEITDEYKNRGMHGIFGKVKTTIANGKTNHVNILVVGNSGKGKSSLINSILGFRLGDDGSAEVGLFSATIGTCAYSRNEYPNFVLWDSSGLVTCNETYLAQIGFENFDGFIIVSGNRFTETDAWLVQASKQLRTPFYFVRTHIDIDILGDNQRNHTKETIFENVREYCFKSITALEIENPDVFIVSNAHPHDYDMNKLIQKLKSFQTESLKEQIKHNIRDKREEIQRAMSDVARRAWWWSMKPCWICTPFNPLKNPLKKFMNEVQVYSGINDDLFEEKFFRQTNDTSRHEQLSKYLDECFNECENMLNYTFKTVSEKENSLHTILN